MKPLTRDFVLEGFRSSKIFELVGQIKSSISDEDRVKLLTTILHPQYKRRFVIGSGRTGFMMKSFAMRLMHLDIGEIYVIGETVTPSIEGKNDLIIAGSGSGTTLEVVDPVKVARELGATILSITSNRNSPLAQNSNIVVYVPVNETLSRIMSLENSANKQEHGYIESQIRGQFERSAILGTLFEDTIAIFLDEAIEICMDILGKTEKDLASRHQNLGKPLKP
jgi:6-phospho-3-hexuloisomerase